MGWRQGKCVKHMTHTHRLETIAMHACALVFLVLHGGRESVNWQKERERESGGRERSGRTGGRGDAGP